MFPSLSFESSAIMEAIEAEGCTHVGAVPSMILALANHPSRGPAALRTLRLAELAGAVVQP